MNIQVYMVIPGWVFQFWADWKKCGSKDHLVVAVEFFRDNRKPVYVVGQAATAVDVVNQSDYFDDLCEIASQFGSRIIQGDGEEGIEYYVSIAHQRALWFERDVLDDVLEPVSCALSMRGDTVLETAS